MEVLVVLALMGIAAGAVGLGSATRGTSARAEADLLAARMRRASDEALLAGRPVALAWSDGRYRFLSLEDGIWMPHSVPLLGTPKSLGGVAFVGEAVGSFAVTEAALPARGAALILELALSGDSGAHPVAVTWDGATATVTESGR